MKKRKEAGVKKSEVNNGETRIKRGKSLLMALALVIVLLFVVVLFLESPTGQAFISKNAPTLAKNWHIPPPIERPAPEKMAEIPESLTKEQRDYEKGVAEAKKGQAFIVDCQVYLAKTMNHVYSEKTIKSLCTCAAYNNFQFSNCLTPLPQFKKPEPVLTTFEDYSSFCTTKVNGKYCVGGGNTKHLQLECKGKQSLTPTPFSYCTEGYACRSITNTKPSAKCEFVDVQCIQKYGVSSGIPFCMDEKTTVACSKGYSTNQKSCANGCYFGVCQ